MLSTLGIYGVVGLMVATRKRELAVRVALGASRRSLLRLVLFGVVRLVLPGVVVGVVLTVVLMRLNAENMGIVLSNFEYVSYVAGAVLIAVIASIARSPPRRLSRTDASPPLGIGLTRQLSLARHANKEENLKMSVHYLEIVSNDVDTLTALYQRMHGLSFGPADPDLGDARVATRADGTLIGIRKPLAAHEQPIMRTYLAVEDIQQAVRKAEDSGAVIAYPPTHQGQRGTFAIVIQGEVQHGLWQR